MRSTCLRLEYKQRRTEPEEKRRAESWFIIIQDPLVQLLLKLPEKYVLGFSVA